MSVCNSRHCLLALSNDFTLIFNLNDIQPKKANPTYECGCKPPSECWSSDVFCLCHVNNKNDLLILEDDCLLGCCAVQSRRNWLMFQRCLLSPSSRRWSLVSTSETLVSFCETTRRNIPEDSHLYTRRENLKSHLLIPGSFKAFSQTYITQSGIIVNDELEGCGRKRS
jgi:hypothetical protein